MGWRHTARELDAIKVRVRPSLHCSWGSSRTAEEARATPSSFGEPTPAKAAPAAERVVSTLHPPDRRAREIHDATVGGQVNDRSLTIPRQPQGHTR
jgi:hypothetical protein